MARTRIIYDRDGSKLAEFVNGECVFSREPAQENSAPAVMGDIQPYQSMADGTWITSRSQHRAHIRQHGLIEIGNEIQAAMQKPQPKHDNTLRKTLVDVYKAMKA